MKYNMIRTLTAIAAMVVGTSAFAQDAAYSVPFKSVSTYGNAVKPNEIVASETPEGFKFVFSGEPAADNSQKAIQLYCEVYKLTPGKYNLKFRIKGQAPATSVVAQLMAQSKNEKAPHVKIGDFKQFALTGDWQDAVLPVEIKEPMLHGYFIMRVGAVPKGGEIYFAPQLTFSPAQ